MKTKQVTVITITFTFTDEKPPPVKFLETLPALMVGLENFDVAMRKSVERVFDTEP
jgi:hypothetical protein